MQRLVRLFSDEFGDEFVKWALEDDDEAAASTPPVVPASILDDRGATFDLVLQEALRQPAFVRLLRERIDSVDAALLPFLIREFSIEEFVEPGMSEAVVRRMLKGAYELHARKGFIDGVRIGLALLGVTITRWQQWFEQAPQGAPGTHRIKLAIDEAVFDAEGHALTQRLMRAIQRMVDGMKRYSQDITMVFEAEATAPVHVGAVVVSRITIRPSIEPVTTLMARAPLFIGAAVSTRLRISPQV